MKPLLEIKNLVVEYQANRQTVHAVNHVNLTLERGKTLGLVGETGAGKTSVALAVTRLLPKLNSTIPEGSISFDGMDLVQMDEQHLREIRGKRISMIFQDPMTSLNPVLQVGKQISEVLEYHTDYTKEQINAEVNRLLELVGIPASRKNEYPHQFSGGMKQRIGIAIALACNPELLIADEPTTALDVTIQAQVLDMMDDLKQKMNTAMILITHDLGIVAESCDTVAVMYAGEIIEYGTVLDILQEGKHHPYTVGLFDSIPKLDVEEERLHPIDGLMPDPSDLPSGCKFHPRCKHCMEICKTVQPPDVGTGTHVIKCHLFSAEGEN